MRQAASQDAATPAGEVSRLAEHLFRHESGKLVSVLTGIFGIERLQLAEDVVQESLIKALQTWPYYGIPKNPAAWITQTAKHLALDVIRRERVFQNKQPQIIQLFEQWPPDAEPGHSLWLANEIKDDRLRLIFACCHPALPQEAQTVLALRTLCGFNSHEIAKAFLTSEAAIAKRLTRARQRIQELHIPFEIPSGEELSARLDGVLQTVYFLFNEGYKASTGDLVVREDLCREAIRLGSLLAEHPRCNQPRTHALLALMLLNGARLEARVDLDGNILRLKDQDRSRWNQAMIAEGMQHLADSAAGEELTTYHLQAAIAACHCAAAEYAATNWAQILTFYDQLVLLAGSPIVALNRAVALAQVHGPEAGIQAIAQVQMEAELKGYYLLYATLGEFEAELGNFDDAAGHFRTALDLAELRSERMLLARRLEEMQHRAAPSSHGQVKQGRDAG